jgi:FSR family fosmidomycin resistance protein-like MFS transporter
LNPLTLPSFIFAHFAHHVGTGGLAPLLPLIRDDFGLDYARSGLLLSAYGLALGFAQLPISALADRMSKRLMIAIGLLGVGLLGIVIAFTTDFWQLIPLLILIGVFASTYHAPAAAFLAGAYTVVARGRALGTHVIGGALAFAAAPIIATGVASLTGSWRMGFLALAVFPIASGLLLLVQLRSDPEVVESARQPREQVNALKALRGIGPLIGVALAEQLLTASMFAYIPLFLVDRHGVPGGLAGLSIGLVAGVGILAAPLGGALSDRIGRAPVLVAVTASVGPLILLFTYAPVGWPIVVVLLLFGLSMNMRLPVLESLFADAIPAHRRSTVLGLYYFIGQESSGLTTPLVGRLIDMTDPVQTFTILGVLGTALSVVLLFTRQTLLAPRTAPAAP